MDPVLTVNFKSGNSCDVELIHDDQADRQIIAIHQNWRFKPTPDEEAEMKQWLLAMLRQCGLQIEYVFTLDGGFVTVGEIPEARRRFLEQAKAIILSRGDTAPTV